MIEIIEETKQFYVIKIITAETFNEELELIKSIPGVEYSIYKKSWVKPLACFDYIDKINKCNDKKLTLQGYVQHRVDVINSYN